MNNKKLSNYSQTTFVKVIILFLLTGLLLSLSYVTLAQANNPLNKAKKVSFLIPVRTRHAVIKYELPEQYKLAYNGSRDQRLFLEFIPKDQQLSNWRNIATIIQFPMIPKTLRARQTVEKVVNDLNKHPQVKFLEKPMILATQSYGIDIQSTTIFYHNGIKDRNEVLMIKSLQGDRDIWMFQATSHYQGDDKSKAIKACQAIMDAITIAKK